MTVERQDFVVFRVKSCADAFIRLSDTQNGKDVYEIAIGEDPQDGPIRSVIRNGKNGTEEAWKDTPGILSCAEFRQFWASWTNGLIQFGTGPVPGQNSIIGWKDPDAFSVTTLSVATGWDTTGEWKFDVKPGKSASYFTVSLLFSFLINIPTSPADKR